MNIHLQNIRTYLDVVQNHTCIYMWYVYFFNSKGREKIVKLLIQHENIDVNANIAGATPLYLAVR